MMGPTTLYETNLKSLKLASRGKVRDIYHVDRSTMLIVTTDRLSAFDVVLPDPIPGKGRVLTSVSNFWFEKLRDIVPNHLTDRTLDEIINDPYERQLIEGRAVIVKKMAPLPIEAIVRGYLIGSGWKDYQQSQSVCGIKLPEGLRQAEKLANPIFSPSTKAEVGGHDVNISFEEASELIGRQLAEKVREVSLRLYVKAVQFAKQRGIIIADTKFEFGLDDNRRLFLIDEALTPDSSRFWPADQYRPGISPLSFDKQFVRDYLDGLDWDKAPPAPRLPKEVLQKSAEKYQEAADKLMR